MRLGVQGSGPPRATSPRRCLKGLCQIRKGVKIRDIRGINHLHALQQSILGRQEANRVDQVIDAAHDPYEVRHLVRPVGHHHLQQSRTAGQQDSRTAGKKDSSNSSRHKTVNVSWNVFRQPKLTIPQPLSTRQLHRPPND